MSDFAVLAYLESRLYINIARKTLKEPVRALLWVFVLLMLALSTVLRMHNQRLASHASVLGEPYTTFIFCGFLTIIAFGVWSAAAGNVVAFSSFADARFLIGSGLRERNVIVWLQLRKIGLRSGRFIIVVFFYAVLFHQAGTFVGLTLTMFGATMLSAALGIPLMKMQRRYGPWIGRAIASAIAACALIPALMIGLGYLTPAASGLSQLALQLGFGQIVARSLGGDWLPIVILYAIVVALVVLSYWGSSDLYPELYHGSLRSFVLAGARRRGVLPALAQLTETRPRVARTPATSSDDSAETFRGAWALLWKDWVVVTRSPRAVKIRASLILAAAFVGALAGAAFDQSSSSAAAVTIFGGTLGVTVAMLLVFASSVALAEDIRKPMWWFSRDPLRVRLYVWLLTGWSTVAVIAAGSVTFGIASQNFTTVILAVPLTVLLIAFLRAIGLALYAVFPSPMDQRGPVAILRALAMMAALAPPSVLALVVAMLSGSLALALISAAFLSIAEVLLLIEFAAWRIASNGAAFAQAEG